MIIRLLCIALFVYWLILIARIILSWATLFNWRPPAALAPAIGTIYDLTEPVLGLFRRYIPPVGMVDLSALFVFVILTFVRAALRC